MTISPKEAQKDPGAWLFAQECKFLLGCADIVSLPTTPYAEVAFAGRSNVGKSSLINALTGRKTLAKTSNTPGRTQQLNFFLLAERLMLVDLPGYGFAQAPKSTVAGWTRLIAQYLQGRSQLRRVCVLVDARHGIKKVDEDIMQVLDSAAVPYQIILTKLDKVPPAELDRVMQTCQDSLKKRPAAHPQILATSAATRGGIDTLRAELARLAQGNIDENA